MAQRAFSVVPLLLRLLAKSTTITAISNADFGLSASPATGAIVRMELNTTHPFGKGPFIVVELQLQVVSEPVHYWGG